jgi:hypothetical protein
MKSIQKSVLFGAVFGLLHLGCAGPDTAADGTKVRASTRALGAGIDISGTWFTKVSTPGKIKAAVSDNVTINAWIRQYVSPTGDVTFDICKLSTTGGTMLQTTYTQAMVNTLETTGVLAAGTVYQPGDSIALPTFVINSGRDATGNSVDAIPPPFPAGDGDGFPGVTIPTTAMGFIHLDVYAGLVITTSMSGVTLGADGTTMSGDTSFSSHGVAFDSTNRLLVPASSTIDVTTNAATIPFTATQLDTDGSTGCDVIATL